MEGPLTGLAVFACLMLSSLLGAAMHLRLREIVFVQGSGIVLRRLVGAVAIVSAVFMAGMLVSLKGSFDTAGREVKHFSALVVDLDRSLRRLGPEAEPAREMLFRYADRVMKDTWRHGGSAGPASEPTDLLLLSGLEAAIARIPVGTPAARAAVMEARRLLQSVVETRWALEERTVGAISPYTIGVAVFWLMLSFGSLGFVAPRRNWVAGLLMLGAVGIGSTVFLLEEYDYPFDGLITVSSEPVQNALFTMTD